MVIAHAYERQWATVWEWLSLQWETITYFVRMITHAMTNINLFCAWLPVPWETMIHCVRTIVHAMSDNDLLRDDDRPWQWSILSMLWQNNI